MSAAKTNAERQREFRARKAQVQTTEVRGIYAHPDDHALIKAAAEKIAKSREKKLARVVDARRSMEVSCER